MPARHDGARMDADALAGRFTAALAGAGVVERGDVVLVALSGGLDSVVLLHLLRGAAPALGIRVAAAHFDHRMRAGSAADAAWVAGLCRAWDVPLQRAAAEPGLAGEAAARAARYAFLHAAAERGGARWIATAHHRDDQAETVLFRILRGTGLRGLRGIPARRDAILRPLLGFRRHELEAYAAAARLRHREDPTNRGGRYARNRIRHQLLPRLEAVAPGAAEALAELAAAAAAAEAGWDWVLDRLERRAVIGDDGRDIQLARERLLSYHPHVRARLLRRLLRRIGSSPDRPGTRAALEFIRGGRSGGEVHLPGGVRLAREFDRILLRRTAAPSAADCPLTIAGPGAGQGTLQAGGVPYHVRWSTGPFGPAGPEAGGAGAAGAELTAEFDASALAFPLRLRGWLPGDRVRLRYGTKKLKKLFAERRVERARRAARPVLSGADGTIIWVVGLARGEGAEPAPDRPVFRIGVWHAE
jgi:tRNA(Ile)-lysidine synthase